MSGVTPEQVTERLRTVNDPELHKDLVSLKMIKNVSIDGGSVRVEVELTTPACPLKDQITRDVTEAVSGLSGVSEVTVEFSAKVKGSGERRNVLPGIKNVIAVGAGKGGVGKSTIAVLLSIALQRSGASVGVMDADVYGPSIPKMFGLEGSKPATAGDKILPIDAGGIKVISIGFMVEPDKPLIWRGPMVHGVVKQFIEQVDWGELDYLIVDLPPGTGDVPLTLAQSIPLTGTVIVCTPQDVALADARRAIMMFKQLNVPCLGIVENMSYYICPKCGNRDEIFDHGGAELTAKELDVFFLGAIALNTQIRVFTDRGTPERTFTAADASIISSVEQFAAVTAGRISVQNAEETAQPTLSIE